MKHTFLARLFGVAVTLSFFGAMFVPMIGKRW